MNRITLKETASVNDAALEIERLEKLFIEAFNKNTKCEMFIFTVGDVKDGTRKHGITIYWDNKFANELDFFKTNAIVSAT
jgi:hypothetical protein